MACSRAEWLGQVLRVCFTQVVIIHVEQGRMHIDEGYMDTMLERGGPHLGHM